MPVTFLEDVYRAQRLGRVRLGHKETKTRKDGTTVEYPVADPFFRVPPELVEYYPGEPTTLKIIFIWDALEHTLPYMLRRYTRSGLQCLGDGSQVQYRLNDDGTVDVRDYNRVDAQGKVVWANAAKTEVARVECAGDTCPHYLKGLCKPTGYLRFVVADYPRLGYYDVVCHQRAIVRIRTQLLLTLQTFGRLTDIPFLLHRGEPEEVPVPTPKGTVNMKIRTQWVEVEPLWFAQAFRSRRQVLQDSLYLKRLQAAQSAALFSTGPDDDRAIEAEYGIDLTDLRDAPAIGAPPMAMPDYLEEAYDGEGLDPNGLEEAEYEEVEDQAPEEVDGRAPEEAAEDQAEDQAPFNSDRIGVGQLFARWTAKDIDAFYHWAASMTLTQAEVDGLLVTSVPDDVERLTPKEARDYVLAEVKRRIDQARAAEAAAPKTRKRGK